MEGGGYMDAGGEVTKAHEYQWGGVLLGDILCWAGMIDDSSFLEQHGQVAGAFERRLPSLGGFSGFFFSLGFLGV